MTKTAQNVTMWQGESVNIDAAMLDENDSPLAITGSTVLWRVTRAGTMKVEKTTAAGITIIDVSSTDDGVRIALSPSDTSSLDCGIYDHECRVTDTSSNQNVFFVGNFELKKSSTL